MPELRRTRAVDAMAREVDDLLEIVQRLQGSILEQHLEVSEALIPVARKIAQARDALADLVVKIGNTRDPSRR